MNSIIPAQPQPQHSDYPHPHGYLYDCPACQLTCHCLPGQSQCIADTQHRVYLTPGDIVPVELPYSEVACHMRVAGRVFAVQLTATGHPAAQILTGDGQLYSFPVTTGEAGLYTDAHGTYVRTADVYCGNCGWRAAACPDWRCVIDWRLEWLCPDCVANRDWSGWTAAGNVLRHN